jgi:uncharacterized membrane protein YgcG
VLDYHSDIRIQPNASLTVHEVIRVNSEGERIRHGIFRDIPTSYKDRLGRQYTVDLRVLEVRRDGSPEPYSQENASNGRRILIGSPDRTLDSGQYTYEITYNVTRELGFFPDHDELYWNVTGNGWEFPIDHASATVTLPGAVNAADLKLAGYTGVKGSRSRNLTFAAVDASTVQFETTFALMASEGLTIVVGFPKGLVSEPSRADRLRWMLEDNAPAIAGFVGLVVVAAYYFLVWMRVGGPARGSIVASYQPPPGLTPAAMRYFLHMGYDDRALVSSVVDLAVKQYLTIRREDRTYQLTRVQRTSGSLPADERDLLYSLFGNKPEITIGSQAGPLSSAKSQLIKNLKLQEGQRLFRKNGWWAVPGILLSLATAIALVLNIRGPMAASAGFMMFWLSGWSFAVITLLLAAVRSWKARQLGVVEIILPLVFTTVEVVVLIILGVMIGVLPMLMLFGLIAANGFGIHRLHAYTAEGRKLMDQVEGFRQYLVEVDSDRIRRLNPPEKTPALFEKLFPYALALGVEQAWAKQFAGVLAQAATAAPGSGTVVYTPDWFTTTQWDTFDTGRFTDSFISDFSSAVSAASTSPGSSSGFSDGGGGGSSGGGGGGGGGGGW